ncbi:hypothetical protein PF003_g7507 [Phytophthora fragariae]|nr:hypothetical protein PF003_g7507 [Phytophthora fragariae]
MEPCDLGSVFNMFGQYQHKYDPSFVINQRLVDMWLNHVKDVICSGDARLYEYLLDWFAHILQHPGVKTQTVPLLKSKPGAGKNFLVNVFARYVLNPCMSIVINDLDRLTGRFNALFVGKTMVMIDEAIDASNRKGNQIMKNKISEDKQPLERKEAHDRRYVCIEVSDKVCPGMPGAKEYWDRVYKPLLTMEAGASTFHWLLRRDITKFNIRNLPETTYKKLLKCKQSNVGVRFLLNKRQQLIDADTDFEQLYTNKDLYAEYVRWTEESNQKLVNDSTFLQMLDSVGFPLKQKRIKGSDSKPRRRVLTRKLIEKNLSQYIVEDEDDEETFTATLKLSKQELQVAHDRIRSHLEKISELTTMINDVQRVDYIKYRLMQIGGHDRAFRYIVSDLRYKGELEQLFDLPFDEILQAYLSMLDRRNRIVHKWTMSMWETGPVPTFVRYRYQQHINYLAKSEYSLSLDIESSESSEPLTHVP